MWMASVRVAVRARPLNAREVELQSSSVLEVKKNTLRITKPKTADQTHPGFAFPDNGQPLMTRSLTSDSQFFGTSTTPTSQGVREFSFDYCFWSCSKEDENYSGQEDVYLSFGSDVVKAAYQGYNACIFAYGQTGSGKTHTMMGSDTEPGLIPRICQDLFGRMAPNPGQQVSYRTQVSYMEIYNEKVHDLLNRNGRTASAPNSSAPSSLRVREHPKNGPYVQDLSHHIVSCYNDIQELMVKGNRLRHTAATKMNDTSSRSHAIFTIIFTQAKFSRNMPEEKFSKIHLVDLAGSERAQATGATGQRLKEGGSINRSLVLLGNVISTLADKSSSRNVFVPYRDSVLTWLLKDSLGGNSKTMMIATVSPAAVNYSETLSTLRYASRAKSIVNRPEVNEDSNVKVIRELREEIARLRDLLGCQGDRPGAEGGGDGVAERLQENEARVAVLTQAWTDRWGETVSVLEEEGVLDLRRLDEGSSGIVLDSKVPYLARISTDSFSTGLELFQLKEGENNIGSDASQAVIVLRGGGIHTLHCSITMTMEESEGAEEEEKSESVPTMMLHPRKGAHCSINTEEVGEPRRLYHGCLLSFGDSALFRFNNPAEAQKMQREGTINRKNNLSLLNRSLLDLSRLDERGSLHNEEVESDRKLTQKRQELAELEDIFARTQARYFQESQRKEKELEAKRRRLQDLQNSLDATRSRLDSKARDSRRRSLDLEQLRICTSPAQLFHRVQADMEQKFAGILASELDKLAKESKELEEQCASQRAILAAEETALQLSLETKRTERNDTLNEISRLKDDLGILDDMLHRDEITSERHVELSQAVTLELDKQLKRLAELDVCLPRLQLEVSEQLDQVRERRIAAEAELSEAARDLQLREKALREEMRDRFNRELGALVEDLVQNRGEGLPWMESPTPARDVLDGEQCSSNVSYEALPDVVTGRLVANEKEVDSVDGDVIDEEEDSMLAQRYQRMRIAAPHRRHSLQIEDEVPGRRLVKARDKRRNHLREESVEEEESRSWDKEEEEEGEEKEDEADEQTEEEAASEGGRQSDEEAVVPHEQESRERRDFQEERRHQRDLTLRYLDHGRSPSLTPVSTNSFEGRLNLMGSIHSLSHSSLRSRSLRSLSFNVTPEPESAPREVQVSIIIFRFIRRSDYVEYEITCNVGDETWSVCRRYSLIRQFHYELRKNYPEINSIAFPPRTNFWQDSCSENLATRRVTQLQTYFEQLLKCLQQHPYCLLNPNKTRTTLCRRIVCQVLPILQKGQFDNTRFTTA